MVFHRKGLSGAGDFVGVVEVLRRSKATVRRGLQPRGLTGVSALWRLLHVTQLVLNPRALQEALAFLCLTVEALQPIRSTHAGLRVQGEVNRALVWTCCHMEAWHGAGNRGVGHSGAGVDQQVTADGAGVGDLALTHRSTTQAGPGLAQLVYLEDYTAQVSSSALVQAARHGQGDGGGGYRHIGRRICIRQFARSKRPEWRLLNSVAHESSCCRGFRERASWGSLLWSSWLRPSRSSQRSHLWSSLLWGRKAGLWSSRGRM